MKKDLGLSWHHDRFLAGIFGFFFGGRDCSFSPSNYGVLLMKKNTSNQNSNMSLSIVESVNAVYEPNITSTLESLEIQSITPEILQSPNADNEYHAIVKSTITTANNKSFAGLGDAYESEDLPRNHVLDYAYGVSIAHAVRLASSCSGAGSNLPQTGSTEVIDIEISELISAPENEIDKSKLNGGGNKPASSKQKELIHKLAEKQCTTGDKASMKICKTHLEELTGAQANQVIKKLKEDEIY